jgi:hypothetical protein
MIALLLELLLVVYSPLAVHFKGFHLLIQDVGESPAMQLFVLVWLRLQQPVVDKTNRRTMLWYIIIYFLRDNISNKSKSLIFLNFVDF